MGGKQGGQSLTRREAIGSLVLSSAVATTRRNATASGQRPNFLFFLTDDQRRDALSAYGNRILHTPNMDRIAGEGIRFNLGFATNSLCRPSRTSILTGQYSHTHGVMHNSDGRNLPGRAALLPDQVTFPHLLHAAGYRTAVIGKWHLLNEPGGFDQWEILPGQGVYLDPIMIVNGVPVKFRGHVCDVVGDQALEFLDRRPKDQPFCLLCHFKAPHRSWIPAERYAHRFDDVVVPEPRTFNDDLEGRPDAVRNTSMGIADLPDFRNRGCPDSLNREQRKRCNLQELVKNYYRVLLSVDENVGRLLTNLDRAGVTDDTVIIYTSDNGFFLGDHGLMDKRLMYEESISVPYMIRYPKLIQQGQVDSQHLVLNIDFAPTILSLAGLPVPSSMQGRSVVPLARGEHNDDWRSSFLYEYYEYPGVHCARKNRGVRTGRWKYIHFWEQPEEFELYDLDNDPNETRNLASNASYKNVLDEMKGRLAQLRRETNDIELPSTDPGPCEFGYGGPVNPAPSVRSP